MQVFLMKETVYSTLFQVTKLFVNGSLPGFAGVKVTSFRYAYNCYSLIKNVSENNYIMYYCYVFAFLFFIY